MCAPDARSKVAFPSHRPHNLIGDLIGSHVPTAIIDGITTRYEVVGSGPPLLMFAPGGFDASLEKWTTLGVYARTKLLDRLSGRYTCIIFDRRECGESGGRVERVTWSHFAAQGKGLLDHLNIERAHLMGGCMGCGPVMAFAVAYPHATLSLVLYASLSCRLDGVPPQRKGQSETDRPTARPIALISGGDPAAGADVDTDDAAERWPGFATPTDPVGWHRAAGRAA